MGTVTLTVIELSGYLYGNCNPAPGEETDEMLDIAEPQQRTEVQSRSKLVTVR